MDGIEPKYTDGKPWFNLWNWQIWRTRWEDKDIEYLTGISDHYENGRPVRTSPAVNIDISNMVVETMNSFYMLRDETWEEHKENTSK
jgi:hypothetical protein